ncbi:MAG: hypothetical protein R3Y66_06635 [Rikenellaceae bacterium]
MRALKSIIVAILTLVICSSCGVSNLSKKIEVQGLATLELKGMAGVKADVSVVNDSRHRIKMQEAEVTLYNNSQRVVVLTQVGETIIPAKSSEDLPTLWKISYINQRSIPTLMSSLGKKSFDGFSFDYTARFSTKGISRRISDENVDLQNFMAIFAK